MSSKKKRLRRRRQHAKATAPKRSPAQKAAWRDLTSLVERNPLVLDIKGRDAGKGELGVAVRLATDHLTRIDGGLPVSPDSEEVILRFPSAFPDTPPLVRVDHLRFLGHTHVLVGHVLCVYLDVGREWHPGIGVDGVIARILEWFEDAAANRFDSRTALYHPIGGLHPSPRFGGKALVVRHAPPAPREQLSIATVNARTPHRDDLLRWDRPPGRNDPASSIPALVIRTTSAIPIGLVGVDVLGEALARVHQAGGPRLDTVTDAIGTVLPNLNDEWLRVIIDVAHPDEPNLSHLACAITPTPDPARATQQSLLHQPIGWITVHDNRAAIATRRDQTRPTAAFNGKTVELWGCGGIGSWIAEFIARAGAAEITLRDSKAVGTGLLVRQNYTETDVGLGKAEQLAARLRSIRDDLKVTPQPGNVLDAIGDGYTTPAHILIDATINVTVAARLDQWVRAASDTPLIAQVATDPRTATLGMLIVADNDVEVGPATIDDSTSSIVRKRSDLEDFHGFWSPLDKSEQLVPAIGCSTPTFHGSAADLAALAGSFVSLIGSHIGAGASGTHLIRSSHAQGPSGTGHQFVRYPSS